ncbi:MAG TPA: MerR family transcriptional regulator [Myxococcales bacterium]|nr:MerR family transcriptional regulator [Myxococcales bacterium]
MTIGEVARRAGLRPSAIRYYEQCGLLPDPPRQGGRRVYDDSILDLVALVQFARGVGFSMREVRALFGQHVGGGPISKRWTALATRKLAAIEGRMKQLRAAQTLLRRILACRCVDPAECGRRLRATRA